MYISTKFILNFLFLFRILFNAPGKNIKFVLFRIAKPDINLQHSVPSQPGQFLLIIGTACVLMDELDQSLMFGNSRFFAVIAIGLYGLSLLSDAAQTTILGHLCIIIDK